MLMMILNPECFSLQAFWTNGLLFCSFNLFFFLIEMIVDLSILKEISPFIHWEDWCWSWNSNTLATWSKELNHWNRTWCWKAVKTGDGDDRGWDGWMASVTWWTWVWASSRSWWWTGKPGMLQSMGSQRVEHNWVTELNKNERASQVPQWVKNLPTV